MKDLTKVIFRVQGGDVTAFMPEIPGTRNVDTCECYCHTEQHSHATLDYVMTGRPATEAEYTPLLLELTRIGYTVKVVKRITRGALAARAAELNRAAEVKS